MLHSLTIRDFAIVEALDLEFERGFTAMTGETGAGKSILIDALALALGERADADSIRAGADRAEVTAEFDINKRKALQAWLAEQALEGDPGQLLMRRVLERNGRSRAFVNGRACTLQQLREAGEQLVDIHGQHAHQSLLRADAQREILDAHAGLEEPKRSLAEAYRDWQRLKRARAEQSTNAQAREAERAQLEWQVDELKQLAVAPGEWDRVQSEHGRLAHAASLIEGAEAALEAVSEAEGSALATASAAASRLQSLLAYDPGLKAMIEMLEGAQAQLQEAAYGLRHYRDRVDLDPSRLKEVEQRLEAIHSSARKFRTQPEALPELYDRQRARLAELTIASDLEALEREEAKAKARYDTAASALSKARAKAAGRIAKDVSGAMKELALGVAQFDVALRPIEGGSAHGNEQVEFLVATNVGTEPRPLGKVASGGELSRISLAIQVVTSKAAAVPTLIFDEVDSGIGGAVAEIVGKRLRALGTDRQVLCVTHLPQVAAQAMQQWSVAKASVKGVTRSTVSPLNERGRIEEIARMLGGTEITPTTRKHAGEMLGIKAR